MKPIFLNEMEEAFARRQHVILNLNTEDRFYFPEQNIGPANLNYFLAAYLSEQGYRVAQYAPSQGVRELSAKGMASQALKGLSSDNDPLHVLNGLSRLLRGKNEKWAFLVLYPETLAPGQHEQMTRSADGVAISEILHALGLDDGIAAGPSRLILVTYSGTPHELLVRSRGYQLIEVGLPCLEERRAFVNFLGSLAGDESDGFGQLEQGLGLDELARLTAGMPLSGIEAAYRAAAHHKQPITLQQIAAIKARAIRNLARDELEVMEPEAGFEEVAGLKSLKSYFIDLIPQIKAGRPGVPQSILFQGVPGCAKSHTARALAKALGWPLVKMGNIRGPLVGESEQRLERAIRVSEQLAPIVLFIDEIDQMLGQRGTGVSGDSGTSERLLARIFEWMGGLQHRGQVVFLAATNRPDILDPALLDRFGVSIPFLKPGPEEMHELIPILLSRFERKLAKLSVDEAAQVFRPFAMTGRELQEIVINAGLLADRKAKGIGAAIGEQHLRQAVADYIGREDIIEMEFIELTALALCSQQSLLPWNDCNGFRSGAEIPQRLLNLQVVQEDGRLDKTRLHVVLNKLKQHRFNQKMMK